MGWSLKVLRLMPWSLVLVSTLTCGIQSGLNQQIEPLDMGNTALTETQSSVVNAESSIPEPTMTPTNLPLSTIVPTVVAPVVSQSLPPTDTPLPRTATPTPSRTFTPILVQITATMSRTLTPTPGPIATLVAQSCPRREACIFSPQTNAIVSSSVQFRGAATRPGFDYYKLEYQLEGTTEWVLIDLSDRSVIFGLLGYWRTIDLPSGAYLVRLTVVDKKGNYWPEQSQVRLIVINEAEKKQENPLDTLQYKPTPTMES